MPPLVQIGAQHRVACFPVVDKLTPLPAEVLGTEPQ
jgi:hypothetical protein